MADSERPLVSTENHLAAVRFATSNLERVVVHLILKTPARHRKEVFNCLMQAYFRWMQEVKKCQIAPEPPKPEPPAGPDPPDCPKNWIPVGDDCIPPDPNSGG